ncbi:3'-5' exonuclease [Nocardia puris]|uniref:DNA 3'-5' helicase n=1 Tax=Nocardia puris TaxID=208602 RepID=A0A366D1F0_9NOCA|nr:3'-5' exonuclease [Nocardia puris]RBO83088.1 AAA domain-containing protein [Nocardia puris]
MRILPDVSPTPEQLTILLDPSPGVLVIRGAAGSGKTTTALLRLKHLCGFWLARRNRLRLQDPVRVLVLTYNRTLEGYVSELAHHQVQENVNLHLTVTTFGKFATDLVGTTPDVVETEQILGELIEPFGMPESFLRDEIQYLLGRFEPHRINEYLTTQRDGRGLSPRMETTTRRRLLDRVVYPYLDKKKTRHLRDWNDIALEAGKSSGMPWDVVIVDEAQDFSANQVRAILKHVADDHSITFVVDTAQRIYPRSFTWKEAGVIQPRSRSLKKNYRNTKQIAAFARGLVEGMAIGDDGALPDLRAANNSGPLPTVLVGKFSDQMKWSISNVVSIASLADESVVFLHPLGGGWFRYVKEQLERYSIPYVQLARSSKWPGGQETVALCTIHSAKGLEFDHVIILGLNQEVTPHGDGAGDAGLENLRRLLAMGIGRARKSVTVGFKQGSASTLIGILNPSTYRKIEL